MTTRLILVASAALASVSPHCQCCTTGKPSIERADLALATRLRVLTVVGAGADAVDFEVAKSVRRQLEDSGLTLVRRPGKWNSHTEVMQAVCVMQQVPAVSGVVFVSYNRLDLRDCLTGATAYEITGNGQEGIQTLTNRLIRYLRQGTATDTTGGNARD